MLVWKEQTWKGGTVDTVMASEMMKEELLYSVHRCTIWQFAIHSSKRKMSMITYRSGTRQSMIDYILVRIQSLRFVKDCKVIPGEAVATQHRPVILEMELENPRKQRKDREKIKLSGGT